MKNRNGLKGDLLWLAPVLGMFWLSASGVLTGHSNSCTESHNVVTCDSREDAAAHGAAEARTKGLAGACVEPRRKYYGDERYTVSLTASGCDSGREFVAAEAGR